MDEELISVDKIQIYKIIHGQKIYIPLRLPMKEWNQGGTKLSCRSRKVKSWPKESFVPPRFQFLS